jgi:arsenate reductase (glutaredoxin)
MADLQLAAVDRGIKWKIGPERAIAPGFFMANIQVFGVKNSPATRAAERFFKERRVAIQMVDLKKKAIAAGEIKRFVERFGWNGLLETEGKAYVEAGLKYLKLSEAELMQRIEREPLLLRLPLVRGGKLASIGQDEESWKAMLAL